MFGYVRAYKPEMKFSEFDTYKAVYCSLCKTLGKEYGALAQYSLSYDFTFLLMLLLSLEDECCGYTKMRCPYNPLKKCMKLKKESSSLSFTAASLVISAYYKIEDNIADSGFFKRLAYRFMRVFYRRHYKKAAENFSEIDVICKNMMLSQAKVEGEKIGNIDLAAEPTAIFLQELFKLKSNNEITSRILGRIGYCAGKMIYLLDAMDDLEDDKKTGGYNPILIKYGDFDVLQMRNETANTINVCLTELASCYELLDIKRYKTILSNIIYLGMPKVIENIKTYGQITVKEEK